MFAAHNAIFAGTAKAGVTFKGAAITSGRLSPGTETVAIPAHSTGDLILMIATSEYTNQGVYTKPSAGGTVPTWTDILTQSSGARVCYAVATSSSTTSGTFGGDTSMLACAVFSGQAASSPIGGSATLNADISSYGLYGYTPTVTLSNTSGSSAIVRFAVSAFNDIGAAGPPLATTNVDTGNTERATSNVTNGYGLGARLATQNDTTTAPDYVLICRANLSATTARSFGLTLEIKK